MDLEAYAKIGTLQEIADRNNIAVPRLRGYRLMSEESPVIISELYEEVEVFCVENLCRTEPFWSMHPDYIYDCHETEVKKRYYLEEKNGDYIRVKWERIHGWKRKVLKKYIHYEKMKIRNQYEAWNRYAGRDDVMYIHARIGGGNWPDYRQEIIGEPWFIEKVDDFFDSTYCDIYARIKKE